jgi:diguanylate cyclase (GGDEF)-like protein
MDAFSLFAANTIILFVMALAFLAAWHGRRAESYWGSWAAANIMLAAALLVFMYQLRLPDAAIVIVPNALLVAGFALRWQAARQFSGRPAPLAAVWAPPALFVLLCMVPIIYAHYFSVYTIVNTVLAVLAAAAAWEFWRDRADGLPSRHGLVAVYGIMALSFAARAGQGIFLNAEMGRGLPQDLLLEIHLTVALFHTVASGAFALSIAYERSTMDLRRAALRDPLTDLHNRRAFEARMREMIARGDSQPFAVALVDIDHFKQINDRYGHAAGDAALRDLARICRETLRKSDLVARMGGEEFAALLPDISAEKAYEVVDRLRRAVSEHEICHEGHRFRLTLSAGLSHSGDGADDFDAVMKAADDQLYRAKRAGRDRVAPFAA